MLSIFVLNNPILPLPELILNVFNELLIVILLAEPFSIVSVLATNELTLALDVNIEYVLRVEALIEDVTVSVEIELKYVKIPLYDITVLILLKFELNIFV